jgi:hypothetical protein
VVDVVDVVEGKPTVVALAFVFAVAVVLGK